MTSGCAELTAVGVPTPTYLVDRVLETAGRLGIDDGLGLLSQRGQLLGLGRSGRASCGGAARLHTTVDGEIALSLARPSDHDLLPAWRALAGPDASAAALAGAAAELGLPCGAVGEVTDRRSAIVTPTGDGPPRPLAGARVINLGSLWAGPLAAHLLARLGADVITVESRTRPDGARATPAFFDAMRVGVRGVQLDLARDLPELLATADVVIEASRPRALDQLGIERDAQVWVSITAYGFAEPHARRVGFGDDAAAAGGLVGRTSDGTTVFLADAIADPLTGLEAAATVADLLAKGGRHHVDLALARVAAAHTDPD